MLIPSGYAQANMRFTGTAAPSGSEITLGLDIDLYTGSPLDAAQAVFEAFTTPGMRAILSSALTISSCLVKFGPNDTGPAAEYSFPTAGTASVACVSPNVTFLVQKQTGFGGRTGRGRLYCPGVTETSVDPSGVLTGPIVSAVSVAFEGWRVGCQTAGLLPVLLHAPNSPVTVPMPITAMVCDPTAATQRRRMRR